MQIEEGFRDMKSRLYGLGFEQNKSTLKRRLTLLILIATLVSLVLILVGLTVQRYTYAIKLCLNRQP